MCPPKFLIPDRVKHKGLVELITPPPEPKEDVFVVRRMSAPSPEPDPILHAIQWEIKRKKARQIMLMRELEQTLFETKRSEPIVHGS